HFADDLRAASAFVHVHGARRLVLIGASLGGAVTLRVAATVPVDGVVTLSAPAQFANVGVSDDLLRSLATPKLFVNSAGDNYASDTQHMYDVASQPKTLVLYPQSSAHGTEMLIAPYGGDLLQQLLSFTAAHMGVA